MEKLSLIRGGTVQSLVSCNQKTPERKLKLTKQEKKKKGLERDYGKK
jgi:hypothetical protein